VGIGGGVNVFFFCVGFFALSTFGGQAQAPRFPQRYIASSAKKKAAPSKMTLAGSLSLSAVGSFRYASELAIRE
jgi:protein-S-isoprenylcysteine O-methyltransferase Ste14